MKALYFLALALTIGVISCSSGLDYFKSLKEDPLKWVDRPPTKEIIGGDSSDHVERWRKNDPDFIEANKKWKEENFHNKDGQRLGRAWRDDSPDAWFGGSNYETDITKLATSGQVDSQPWSSDYWPIAYGILSVRYANNEKNTLTDANGNDLNWEQSVAVYSEPKDYQDAEAAGNVDDYIANYFSPAEKYDVLVGDTDDFTLTNNNKNQGSEYSRNGEVEGWMGICHGWAPAAFSLPRPQNDVTVTAADGKTKVKFYADDIRGLASLKYAATEYQNIFVGGRCNLDGKKVKKDKASGLAVDYDCFDVNPGTWTIIIADRVGKQKKSFVIDSTWDMQVWNQPVLSYSMSFFNVISNDAKDSVDAAKIAISDLDNQGNAVLKFVRKMANDKATHVVGVSMDIVWIAETVPSHDPPKKDRQVKATYVYTLELDDQNNIVGGEWLQNKHPDFVWAPADGAKPLNKEDNQIQSSISGDISSPSVLSHLTKYAKSASNRGEVLDIVVEYLVNQSSGSRLLGDSVEEEYKRLSRAYRKARRDLARFLEN